MSDQQYMVILSLDAMGGIDFETAQKMPNFQRLLSQSSYCKQVKSVYPSLTYPAHTTIVTGRKPANHGIINNTLFQPSRLSPDWYWHRKYVTCTTLYDEALKKGMTVASLLWPVTAQSKITYNMPEIFANRPWSNQIVTSLINGTPSYQIRMNHLFGKIRNGLSQPELDNFNQACLKYTISNYKPNLILAHMTDLDTQRHHFGVYSDDARLALRRHDERVGQVMDTMAQAGMDIGKNATLVVLGDHSQLDLVQPVLMNKKLLEKGYLKLKKGVISEWQVICKNCDGSAYIYINHDVMNRAKFIWLQKEISEWLKELQADPANGILAVYSGKNAATMGADPDCEFVLEARSGFYFQDELDENNIQNPQKATHGYHPERENYRTVFMIAGPGIKKNYKIKAMSLIDEGPTMARILGVKLPRPDGRVIEEIFE